MPAATRTPRTTWVEAGLAALAEGGPGAVRIEPLAQSLGVTKGGFYWHFDSRQALLDEMLDTWEHALVDQVIESVEAEGGGARRRLWHLFALAEQAVGHEFLKAELAIRNWARRDSRVAARLRRVDNRRMDYMRSLFREFCRDEDDVEVRCLLVFSLFIGDQFIAAEHDGRERSDVVRSTLAWLLAPAPAR